MSPERGIGFQCGVSMRSGEGGHWRTVVTLRTERIRTLSDLRICREGNAPSDLGVTDQPSA